MYIQMTFNRGSRRASRRASQSGLRVTRRANSNARDADVLHVKKFKSSISDIWLKLRKQRRDAYLAYARNAKFMMRIGAIPHLRMYHTLKIENELYSDFCKQYMDLNKLIQLFIRGGWETEQKMRSQEHAFGKAMERVHTQYTSEIEAIKADLSARYTDAVGIIQNKAYMEAKRDFDRMLEIQTDKITREKESLVFSQSRKHAYETAQMQNLIHKLETDLKKADAENVLMLEQNAELGVQNAELMHEVQVRDASLEELQQMMAELEERIRGLYVYEMAQAGWEFVTNVFERSYAFLKEKGKQADEEVRRAARERNEQRRQHKAEAERILREMQEEAQRLAEKLAQEKERMKKEEEERKQREQREKEEKEREQKEKEQTQKEQEKQKEREKKEQTKRNKASSAEDRFHKEQEKKDKEEEARARLNLGKDRDALLTTYKQIVADDARLSANIKGTDAETKCVNLLQVSPIAPPRCQSGSTRKKIRDALMKTHPDKNKACDASKDKNGKIIQYSTKKSQYFTALKDYHNRLPDCSK